MWKFIVGIGAGITLVIFGVLALGLGVLNSIHFLIVGGLACMTVAVAVIWLAAQQLVSPNFLRSMIVRSINRGRWTNTLCPVCGWWMRIDQTMQNESGVNYWYCVNKHPGAAPNPPTGGKAQ